MQGNSQLYVEEVDPLEEAAVLFSAGFADAAMDLLVATLRADRPAGDRRPWLMLLDVYAATGRRSAYELVAARYARTFRLAPPAWGNAAPAEDANTIVLAGDMAKATDLDPLFKAAASRKIVVVDMGQVGRIHFSHAMTFAAALKELKIRGKRVILIHTSEVHATLLEMLGAQDCAVLMRRKPTDVPEALAA